MKTLFNKSILILLKYYNYFYFKRIKVYGVDNIPKKGGLIFSPNHQGALLDAILVGTTCKRELNSLTRSDVFGGPFQWFLDALKMLPVYRFRDGYSNLKKNNAVFERCHELLGKENNLMIFSEGSHHNEYFLKRLSKGSSRLILEAQEKYPKTQMYIVPVGINYSHHQMPWQEVHIVYGEPIYVGGFLEDYLENNILSINRLRQALEIGMKSCLWIPENDQNYLKKKEQINLQNSKLGFWVLKRSLDVNSKKLKVSKAGGALISFLISLLSIPNIIPLLIMRNIISLFSDIVFHNSVKYLLGLVIFSFWWEILILSGIYFGSISTGILTFVGSLALLYLRQELISCFRH
tara:strand:- start:5235 stop:6281 length:1047 start_codon:yes stop_codon:yes gene_type:complete